MHVADTAPTLQFDLRLIARLAVSPGFESRYQLGPVIGQGGMGTVFRPPAE